MAYPLAMACRDNRLLGGLPPALGLFLCLWPRFAVAQNPPGASFPADPAPAPPAPVAPPPATAPVPAPAPAPGPAPATAPQPVAPPAPAPAAAPPPQPYASDPRAQPGYGTAYGEPPPPPAPAEDDKSSIPPFSVRLDPFNWILEGQLGFEVEVGLAKWLSVETVPMFVVDDTPPWLNLGGGDSRVYQHSGGLGALAGATLGINFWPKKVFKGYVIRTGFTNYSLEYETKDEAGKRVDFVPHTKRQFYVMLASVERWGAFTLGGGIGLGYDLNKESRCIADSPVFDPAEAKPGNCDEIQIAVPVSRTQVTPVAVTPFTYPWELLARFSLGVTID